MGWDPGDAVIICDVLDGLLVRAKAVIVVEDSADATVVWMPMGAELLDMDATGQRSRFDALVGRAWTLVRRTWQMTGVLTVVPCGAPFAVQRLIGPDEDRVHVTGWYVNLQDPLSRTDRGFDTMDRQLDIVVEPDLGTWSLKDEDVFEEALRRGLHSLTDHESVLRARTAAIELISRRDPLFEGWRDWAPPTSWELPRLPANFG